MKFKFLILITLMLLLVSCVDRTPVDPKPIDEQESAKRNNDTTQSNTKKNIDREMSEHDNIAFPEASLQKMDQGVNVVLLQEALKDIGYELPIDGFYSDVTTWAITDFQLQMNDLSVTGIYDDATKLSLESMTEEGKTIEIGAGLPPLAEPAITNAGTKIMENPYDLLAIVNKENALPKDYTPNDLTVPDVLFPFTEDLPKKQLRAPAARALEDLFAVAEEAGHQLFAQSGFRSYKRQVSLFTAYSKEHGEEAANIFSARPGESEHQSGLSIDITSANVGHQLVTAFGETPEGEWVANHADEFGFIIRYPEGKEDITQYQFEPWHLRYVGDKAAKEIKEADMTLEEYFDEVN